MNNTGRKLITSLQVMAAAFMALCSHDISGVIITNLYIKIEGHYLPYGGLHYEYYFWKLFLAGALSVVLSYAILFNIKNNTYITSAILLIPFMFFSLYQYKIAGELYFSYEIIIGGLTVIGLYEVIKKNCF